MMEIEVRRLCEADLEKTRVWRMQPDITRYMNTDPVLTSQMQKTWFDKVSADPAYRYFMVKVGHQDAGVINLADIDWEKKESCWAYYIAVKRLRSFELAVTLEWNLYDYAFEKCGLHRLYNEVFCENKGVIRLHEFCGSKVETILKKHVQKNGRDYDVAVGSITAADWKVKKKEADYRRIEFI